MKRVMMPMMSLIGSKFGMAHSITKGAKRYIDVTTQEVNGNNGAFYASPPTKMTGTLIKQDFPHLADKELQEAGWETIVKMTGGIDLEVMHN